MIEKKKEKGLVRNIHLHVLYNAKFQTEQLDSTECFTWIISIKELKSSLKISEF